MGEAPLRLRALLQRGPQPGHGLAPPLLIAQLLQQPHALHIPATTLIESHQQTVVLTHPVRRCHGRVYTGAAGTSWRSAWLYLVIVIECIRATGVLAKVQLYGMGGQRTAG